MTAVAPVISYSDGTLTYAGTGSIAWTINNTNAGSSAGLVVSGLTQNSKIVLSVDSSPVATVKVVTASDFGDGEVFLEAHNADYVIWNGTGAAPARAVIAYDTAVLQAAETQGVPEAFQMSDAAGVVGTLYSNVDGFFQLDQGAQTVYIAGFSAVLVDTKALALSTLYEYPDSSGNVDVIGTPFSGDVLDVAVTAAPTASATDATDSTRVNFTDGSDNIVAYYTTTLDQTDRDEGFTGKVVANNADGTTTTYYVQGIESLAFDTLTPSGASFSYTLSGGGTTEPPVVDPNAPDYTTADDTEHAGYVGDSADNYAVISDGVSGNYSINGAGGFDVVEIKDQVLLGDNRVIESKTAADTYLVQSRINGDFVTIGTIARNGDGDVVLTKRADQQVTATVTLTAVEALALVEPPAYEGDTPVTELVPLTILTEVDPTDGYVSIQGSIFSDQIAIDSSLSTPFIGEVMGDGGSDRVAVNLGGLAAGSAFVLDGTPLIANYSTIYTYINDANTTDDTADDLVLTVAISQPYGMWDIFDDPDIYVLVETSSQTPVTVFDAALTAVDTLEIGGLTLDLGRMAELALRDAAEVLGDEVVTRAGGHPRDDWDQAAPATRAEGEDDLRVDASAETTSKVLIGFDDDFIVDIGGTPTPLTEELRGGSADDVLIGRGGHNRLDGGDGYDTVDYSFAGEAVRVSLFEVGEQFTGVSNDTLARVENIVGTYNSDILGGNGRQNGVDGGMGDDFIDGGRGNDHLLGGEGNDHIMGGVGNDVIEGGFGNDTLSGGIGRDTFVFNYSDSELIMGTVMDGVDVITDFNPYADKILLTNQGGGGMYTATVFANEVARVGDVPSTLADLIDSHIRFEWDAGNNVGSLMLQRDAGVSQGEIEVVSFQTGLDLTGFDVSSYVNVDVLSFQMV